MHTRRFSMLILGAWVGLTLAMMFVAIENFRGVDRLLESLQGESAKVFAKMGHEQGRMFLRFQVSELNRYFFDYYGIAQLALGFLLALTLLFATNGNKIILGVTLGLIGLVAFQRFLLFPEITYLGRLLDFQTSASAIRSRFWSFHQMYSVSEIVKLLIFIGLGAKMLVRTDRPRRSRAVEVDEEIVVTPR